MIARVQTPSVASHPFRESIERRFRQELSGSTIGDQERQRFCSQSIVCSARALDEWRPRLRRELQRLDEHLIELPPTVHTHRCLTFA
jgi:predicted RNA-binding Zn ribbon-like protein